MLEPKKFLLLVPMFALSACVTAPDHDDLLASTVRTCMVQNAHFIDAWGCFQGRYAMGEISDTDPRLKTFLKLGDDLARQVEAKKLTDPKAKDKLSSGLPKDLG